MRTPSLLLVPGYWLGAWAWDEVLEELATRDCRATALTLPGLEEADPDRTSRTLDDQAATIEQAAAQAPEPVIIAAHSGANGPVSLVLDRHPETISRVVWVDTGPATSGSAFDADLPENAEGLALPAFEELGEHASLEGLSAEVLDRFRARALSEPAGVVRQVVELSDERRFAIPTTFVCCSIPSAQLRELAQAGHPMFAEVGSYTDVDFIDLPTGHWPMWSRPAELAEILATVPTV